MKTWLFALTIAAGIVAFAFLQASDYRDQREQECSSAGYKYDSKHDVCWTTVEKLREQTTNLNKE